MNDEIQVSDKESKFEVVGFLCLISLLLSLILSRGLGNKFVFDISCLLLLGGALWFCFLNHCYPAFVKVVFCVAILAVLWPATYLYGFWVFVISQISKQKTLSNYFGCVILILWIIQISELGSWINIPVICFACFFILMIVVRLCPKYIYYFLLLACIVITLISLIQPRREVQIANNTNLSYGYRHGRVLAKILQGELVDYNNVSGQIGITSLIQHSGHNKSDFPIILVDHDQYHNTDYSVIKPYNIKQARPWHNNQMFGDQYMLAAISDDGLWISNIGGSLSRTGKLILGSFVNGTLEPLIIKRNGAIYINDSDPFVDRLANYQKSGILEIVYGSREYRFINILFLLATLFNEKRYVSWIFILLIFIFIIVFTNKRIDGDIRVVGKIHNPHEPSKISGVLRTVIDSGFPYTLGNDGTVLLIVGPGKKTCVKSTEKVVVACEGATIFLNDHTVKIDTIPLGNIKNIIDARRVFVDGLDSGAWTTIDGVIVLGTGSPARQDWRKWLASLE